MIGGSSDTLIVSGTNRIVRVLSLPCMMTSKSYASDSDLVIVLRILGMVSGIGFVGSSCSKDGCLAW